MKKLTAFTIFLAVFLAACAPGAQSGVSTPIEITAQVSTAIAEPAIRPGTEVPFATPEPPTLIPTISSGLSPTELKYRVLDEFPDFFFCDPDFYPVARADELVLALERFPELQANAEEFQTILNHNGMNGQSNFTDEEKLSIYREHKKLNAIYFELIGDAYQFQIQTGMEGQEGFVVKGTIDGRGSIDLQERTTGFPMCPICLAAGTMIDTPRGAIRVENVRVGDQVWTRDEAGERVVAVVLKAGSVRVPITHQIVHVILDDGRELHASPGHPTADGRTLADLKVGDMLDSARVITVERVRYEGSATFDILPAGATGLYWANGILIGSTLKP